MYPFQEDADEDLPNEIVAELDARNRIQSNVNDEDESIFSDVVQDAFKKYQNEVYDEKETVQKKIISIFVIFVQYSKYWTYDDTVV
jgi:hypothetical protein